ncbi:Methyltransferase domain-containing protein [Streptomyces sp. DfronAA-171]|nr:Methyltransferase domain-containing protein [Streptomyces sp. DfronAA-171]
MSAPAAGGPGVSAPVAPAAWAASDPYAAALRAGRGPLFLRRADGWLLPLEVERWCAAADRADRAALDRCEGRVLDVGCGPGRLVAELAGRGRTALGVDVSEAAVAHTGRLGGRAVRRSVFEPLPGEGRWGTVLLMDGNIGIGGRRARSWSGWPSCSPRAACSSPRPRRGTWTSAPRCRWWTPGAP